ncbi:uncharacterized protein BJ171DRAFT_164767 [Polychytrium aggregatum]|uniref:uncharacterized protein n=1 Tax=Polychytrium aggregatum TaxID=110093 RepID=UPI0022FF12B7|nr:uncharacterized protein BJ171DRAFT_164767 [Polychytrium aggregatum]KAI9202627.1 hypothetical protein BJ171DRAFT_164767 [Polychytrium aggregatum]
MNHTIPVRRLFFIFYFFALLSLLPHQQPATSSSLSLGLAKFVHCSVFLLFLLFIARRLRSLPFFLTLFFLLFFFPPSCSFRRYKSLTSFCSFSFLSSFLCSFLLALNTLLLLSCHFIENAINRPTTHFGITHVLDQPLLTPPPTLFYL